MTYSYTGAETRAELQSAPPLERIRNRTQQESGRHVIADRAAVRVREYQCQRAHRVREAVSGERCQRSAGREAGGDVLACRDDGRGGGSAVRRERRGGGVGGGGVLPPDDRAAV